MMSQCPLCSVRVNPCTYECVHAPPRQTRPVMTTLNCSARATRGQHTVSARSAHGQHAVSTARRALTIDNVALVRQNMSPNHPKFKVCVCFFDFARIRHTTDAP